jgi:hypothetical protein
MDSERFDALSRLLATPMPRRRGLQLLATAVAGVLGLGGAKTALAGQRCPPPSPAPGTVPNGCPCIGATDCRSGACCSGVCCQPPPSNCLAGGQSCNNNNRCCSRACCGGICCANNLSCQGGSCGCAPGQQLCVSLQTCVNCPAGCGLDGACACVCCQAPREFCGGFCVDPCPCSGQTRNPNTCQCACPSGGECCQGQCYDAPCSCSGQTRNPSTCQCECPSGQPCCNGRCTDTQNDPMNCGACGQACPQGYGCAGGMCVPPGCQQNSDCPTGQTCCFGVGPGGTNVCINTSSDPNNCGGCGIRCGCTGCSGGQCGGGTCLPEGSLCNPGPDGPRCCCNDCFQTFLGSSTYRCACIPSGGDCRAQCTPGVPFAIPCCSHTQGGQDPICTPDFCVCP